LPIGLQRPEEEAVTIVVKLELFVAFSSTAAEDLDSDIG
jgi:hypothetical protein